MNEEMELTRANGERYRDPEPEIPLYPQPTFQPDLNRGEIAKWMQYLLYCQFGLFVLSLLTSLGNWVSYVSILVNFGSTFCLYKMVSANQRYNKAFTFRLVFLICTVVVLVIKGAALLSLAGSVFSILAVYQEYKGHSELISNANADLSKKWSSLFGWSLATGLLSGLLSVALSVVLAMMGWYAASIITILITLASIPGVIVQFFYLRYLKRTLALVQE